MKVIRIAYRITAGKSEGNRLLGDIGVDGGIILLKWIF
jgi:hypothetical protein